MSAIKSVQRGINAVVSGTTNITISSVNTSKTMLKLSSNTNVEYNSGSETLIRLSLTSPTNLEIYSSGSYTVSWEVIEYV